jgi:acetyl/propionyl-CoA carboxylase alpha subunit
MTGSSNVPKPLRKVLVANRGEIAARVCRGLRECGIESVSVWSDPDRDAPHRFAADFDVPLVGISAADTYLAIDKIVAAAKETGCDGVHPGYGFLSENARFARAVEKAGMTFVGPTAESMELLGDKQAARAAAEKIGVPTVPGWNEDDGDDQRVIAAVETVGYPVMIKAAAGGGGKGMRAVEKGGDFAAELAAARREAMSAFGDDRVLLERRVFPARHVEIQILGDNHGKVVSLHERECSVQRRHQKVLEESPSPAVDPDLRARMGASAVQLAESVGYRNAGTVEFLVDGEGNFFFLEVNTRLQVEHPVTELVTGLDLVHLQLAVAGGAKIDDLLPDGVPAPRGHAVEARIYAEVPERGFLPAVGRLSVVHEPRGPGVRVDSGVASGSEVTVHYDPMLSKLIVHAPDRRSACMRLAEALADACYLGIDTNVDFLRRVVLSERFLSGELRTDFLDLEPELAAGPKNTGPSTEALVAAVLAPMLGAESGRGSAGGTAVATSGGEQPGAFAQLGANFRLWAN